MGHISRPITPRVRDSGGLQYISSHPLVARIIECLGLCHLLYPCLDCVAPVMDPPRQ
jgi:hypothetical protein